VILGIFAVFFILSLLAFFLARWGYNLNLSFFRFLFLLPKFLLQLAMVFVITIYFISRNSMSRFLTLLVILTAVSALVGFGQFLGISWFWKLKYLLTTNPDAYIEKFIHSHNDPQRAVGLSLYFIPLSYETLLVFPLSLFLVFKNTGRQRIFYGIISFIILLGIISSKTISAYLGVFIILIFLLGKKKYSNIIGVILLITGIVSLSLPHYVYSIFATLKIRVGFWIVALLTVSHYPWGIPFLREYGVFSSQFYNVVRNFCGDIVGASPHNQFLNTFISYGVISIFPYAFFLWYIFRRIMFCQKEISLFLQASVIAYFAHSFFHNLGPFYNDVFFWVIMGCYCCCALTERIGNDGKVYF
jgi:hypothetical protein